MRQACSELSRSVVCLRKNCICRLTNVYFEVSSCSGLTFKSPLCISLLCSCIIIYIFTEFHSFSQHIIFQISSRGYIHQQIFIL
jgi:hypothetical protein